MDKQKNAAANTALGMSKERLDEIVGDLLNNRLELTSFVSENLEQAERVQELERVNKQLKGNLSVYKGYYKNMIKINEGIVEENKRYREKINVALALLESVPFRQPEASSAVKHLNKALEERQWTN